MCQHDDRMLIFPFQKCGWGGDAAEAKRKRQLGTQPFNLTINLQKNIIRLMSAYDSMQQPHTGELSGGVFVSTGKLVHNTSTCNSTDSISSDRSFQRNCGHDLHQRQGLCRVFSSKGCMWLSKPFVLNYAGGNGAHDTSAGSER